MLGYLQTNQAGSLPRVFRGPLNVPLFISETLVCLKEKGCFAGLPTEVRCPRGLLPHPLCWSHEQIGLSTSRHQGNKWPPRLPQEALHFGQRFHKSCCHLIRPQVSARKNKCSHLRRQKGRSLRLPVAKHFVLGEDDPSLLADRTEPVFILRVGWKVVLVNLDGDAVLAESLGENPVAEGTVDEIGDGPTRLLGVRARSGWLPQCLTARNRNRLPRLPLIRRR